jgi:hypothetical protein
MDKFEHILKDFPGMTPEQQTKLVESLKAMCICPTCPTHTTCAKNANELLFCWNGKSFMCIDTEKDCSCPRCPVVPEVGIRHKSFCTRGSEKAQRYERTLWGSTLVR